MSRWSIFFRRVSRPEFGIDPGLRTADLAAAADVLLSDGLRRRQPSELGLLVVRPRLLGPTPEAVPRPARFLQRQPDGRQILAGKIHADVSGQG